MKTYRLMAILGLALVAQIATAQTTPQRIRGTITGVDGNVLEVKTREGWGRRRLHPRRCSR